MKKRIFKSSVIASVIVGSLAVVSCGGEEDKDTANIHQAGDKRSGRNGRIGPNTMKEKW